MDDLYPGNSYNADSESAENTEILLKINRIEEDLRKMYKRKKKGGKKGKKKKLKKQNKLLKQENEQMSYLLQSLAMQKNSKQKKPEWWQELIIKSAPNSINMVSSILQNNAKSKKRD